MLLNVPHHQPSPFKWRHFEVEIILLCLRWYVRFPLSYRDLEEMLLERGLQVEHTTISRWVQQYAPALERGGPAHLKTTAIQGSVDETSIKVMGTWMYLYRAVDSQGNTLEFLLESDTRCPGRQTVFPQRACGASYCNPRVITVDKTPSYPKTLKESKKEGIVPQE